MFDLPSHLNHCLLFFPTVMGVAVWHTRTMHIKWSNYLYFIHLHRSLWFGRFKLFQAMQLRAPTFEHQVPGDRTRIPSRYCSNKFNRRSVWLRARPWQQPPWVMLNKYLHANFFSNLNWVYIYIYIHHYINLVVGVQCYLISRYFKGTRP